MTANRATPGTEILTVADGDIKVRVRITGAGRPVLLLNGLSRTMGSWVHVRSRLRDRMIIMFDAPGVGASSTPAFPYTMSMLSNLVVKVLDGVGVDSADVVGYSHGGAVAQQFAIDHRDRLKRLVLLSTSCGIGSIPGNGWEYARALSRQPGSHVPRWAANPLGLLWQIAAYSTWTSLPFLRGIEAETLVVHGRRDRVVPVANGRVLATCIPDARLEALDAGHDLQAYHSAPSVSGLINEFLKRLSTT